MDNAFRYIVMGSSILCIIVWVWLVRIHPPLWPTVCLPVALFVHTIIFYAVAIDRAAQPSASMTIWSSGLRVHENLTWLIGGLIMGHVLARAKRLTGQK